jgi:ribosomal protein S18 acetylase RimI-like enzyme
MPVVKRGAGSLLEWRQGSSGTIEIFDIKVNRPDRRQGVGRSMVEELIETQKPNRLYCFTRSDNGVAHRFYEALGFKAITVINGFYEDDCKDAIMYLK